MTADATGWRPGRADQATAGDTVRVGDMSLLVCRIEPAFFGRPEMLALIEDTPQRWYKLALPVDAPVEICR